MKHNYLKSLFLMLMMCVGMSAWADTTGTIKFGKNDVQINAASVTGDDDLGNTWTITTVGTTSFTTNASYYQVGASKSPATSITFTTTLPKETEITAMSALFGGFSGTAGTVTMKVGETTIGTGNLDAANDVTVNSTSTATGTVLTVTVTDIAKGVKVYNITYTIKDENTSTVTAPTFDVAAGTYPENKIVKISNYSSDYLYAYTLDGSNPAFDENLDVTSGTLYDKNKGIEITSSCTLKVIAVDEDGNASSITSAAYTINKPQVFASLDELVAADLATGTNVTVSFENVAIKSFYTNSSNVRTGVYFDIQKGDKDIEIYYYGVPNEWVEGGTLSGTLTNCPWKLYSGTWELAPASGWAWTNLTYTAPAQKTITALEVSGTPTKTTYNVGDAFETAGLTVTATYSDETTATITEGFEWEIDYGTGNEALVAGATSVDVMVYTEDVMSEVYTVNGLTVTVPVTLTSITVSGTPTKTEYYVGDAFETAGLVVTGTYSDSHQETITKGIEWTIDPESLALGTTSVNVMAGVGSIVSEEYTVNGLTVTENPYKTATISSFSATSGNINSDISYASYKGQSTADPYLNNGKIRLYQEGGYVTITAATGLKIASVKITTSETYASTTVGYCVDDDDAPTTGETVAKSSEYTISDLNNNSVSIYCLGTDKYTRLEIAAIEVTYSGTAVNELKNIELSGTYPTEFTKGDVFSHEGMTVTANYTDGSDADVTSSATFSGYDMNSIGEQTVTVSYTENEITKTATYTLTVTKAPFVPTPVDEGYETVDFTTLYSSVSTSATVEDYEGTSFAMAFAKPQSSSTPTKYYNSGTSVRAYTGNTITITGAENITNVDIAWSAEKGEDTGVTIDGLGTKTAVITFANTCSFTDITVVYSCPSLTISAAGYATYYNATAYKMPVGVEGKIMKEVEGTVKSVVAYEAGAVVPAETALLLKGEAGNYPLIPTSKEGTNAEGNLLHGNLEAGLTTGGDADAKYYKFANGDNGLGWYYGSSENTDGHAFTIGANKAYLVINGSSKVKALSFVSIEDNEEDAIKNVEEKTFDTVIYDMQGRKVSKAQKGLYIVNGKKYMVK